MIVDESDATHHDDPDDVGYEAENKVPLAVLETKKATYGRRNRIECDDWQQKCCHMGRQI